MVQYIFIHGKNASLSQYELQCVFGDELEEQESSYSLVKSNRTVDQQLLNMLGGTIKICQVFSEDPVERILKTSKSQKILFAVSKFGGQEPLSEILSTVKDQLRGRGRNARFLNKHAENVSSGQLVKSGILAKGIDLVRCVIGDKKIWGETIAVQDIDAYSLRDYGKPYRNMKVGMMPPKLAQIMINFAQPGSGEKRATIYDPFCGVGAIPMEAMLRGNPVMGSDIKGRLVHATLKNLEWLLSQFRVQSSEFRVPNLKFKVESSKLGTWNLELFFQHDATQPFPRQKFPEDMTVVSEGYLGPPLLRFPNSEQQKEIFDLLHAINSKFFFEISRIITKGKRLVFCFPFFKSGKQQIFYPESFIKEYTARGFEIVNESKSLLYERKEQVVGREIMIFLKQ